MQRFKTTRRGFLALAGAAGLTRLALARAGDARGGFVAHEWGTFTTLQDENGRELFGINIDDEPVPEFVHNLNPYVVAQPFVSGAHWRYRQKGAPRHHPLVSMRLETPVIYLLSTGRAGRPDASRCRGALPRRLADRILSRRRAGGARPDR